MGVASTRSSSIIRAVVGLARAVVRPGTTPWQQALLHSRISLLRSAPRSAIGVGLHARELTAPEVVLGLDRYIGGMAGPGNSGDRTENGGWIDGVRAVDAHTVVVDLSSLNVARYLQMMERAPICPIKVVEANPQEFDKLAGTGPFMLEEYAVGSSLTFGTRSITRDGLPWLTATRPG